jgi:hypothetical protein
MKKIKKHKNKILYFLKNAPLAIITSALPGFVNYAAILFLTSQASFEEVGQYRLIMSYFSLMGLFSLMESNKIQVRAAASGETQITSMIFFSRFYGMLFCLLLAGLAFWYNSYTNGFNLAPSLLIVAFFAFLHYPTDLLISTFQAQKKFGLLAVLTFVKYLLSLTILIGFLMMGASVVVATFFQIAAMTLVNVIFFIVWLGRQMLDTISWDLINPIALVKSPQVKDAFTLSFAKILPSTLEHADKMIIGYLFGLETLGLYTLAFSTGRFIYNALKPAFYIYYRHYVDALPPRHLLNIVMVVFSVFGIFLSITFYACTLYLPAFAKFEGAETVVYIFFLSYGIAMVDAIYTQSYGINPQANTRHFLVANTVVSLLCYLLFASCTILSAHASMIVCALHYPLWHAGTIYMLYRMRIRGKPVS